MEWHAQHAMNKAGLLALHVTQKDYNGDTSMAEVRAVLIGGAVAGGL